MLNSMRERPIPGMSTGEATINVYDSELLLPKSIGEQVLENVRELFVKDADGLFAEEVTSLKDGADLNTGLYRNPDVAILAAVDKYRHRLMGCIQVQFAIMGDLRPEWRTLPTLASLPDTEDVGVLSWLRINEEYRRNGVGMALVNEAMSVVKLRRWEARKGEVNFALNTIPGDNGNPSRDLFEKLGFRMEVVQDYERIADGQVVSVPMMVRRPQRS